MKHYEEEARHLLKKLVNAGRLTIDNEELLVDIIADELEELIDEDIDPQTLGCGNDLIID